MQADSADDGAFCHGSGPLVTGTAVTVSEHERRQMISEWHCGSEHDPVGSATRPTPIVPNVPLSLSVWFHLCDMHMRSNLAAFVALVLTCYCLCLAVSADARRHHVRRHLRAPTASCPKYVSTDTLVGMSGSDLSQIKPPLRVCPGLAMASCTSAFQPAVGIAGPLGPGGPLGWGRLLMPHVQPRVCKCAAILVTL